MPIYKTTGFILKRKNLGEYDRILTIFTNDYGKMNAVAKSVRKIKSKLSGNLEPFIFNEIHLAKGKNLDVVTSVNYKHSFKFEEQDLKIIFTGYLLMEMVDKLLPFDQPNIGVFSLLKESFEGLEKGYDPDMVKIYYFTKLLKSIGHQPNLEAGNINTKFFLSLRNGNLVSKNNHDSVEIDIDSIKILRLNLIYSLSEINKVKFDKRVLNKVQDLLNQFYSYQFDVSFNSDTILK